MTKLSEWLSTQERQKEFAQEELIVEAAEEIWEAMAVANVSKSEVAERLGKSKAFISQLLNGSRNMTLRSLADIAHSIGYKASISLAPQSAVATWQPLRDAFVVQFDQRYLSPAPLSEPIDVFANGNWTPIPKRAA